MSRQVVSSWSRAGLSVTDQVVASSSNIALTLLVAHALPLTEFGRYALTLAGYQVVVTMARAVVGEPLMVLAGRTSDRAARGALGLSLLLGLAALVIMGAAWLVFRQLGPSLLVLALLMPGLLLQDAVRFAAFAATRPQVALLSDVLWAAGQVGLTVWVLTGDGLAVPLLILAWGAPASLAAAAGLVSLRTWPVLSEVPAWIRRSKHLSKQYAGEALTSLAGFQAVLYITAALAGIAAAGQLRIVQVLFGPVHVCVTGARLFGLPEVARRLRAGDTAARVVLACAVLLGGMSISWTVGISSLPSSWILAVLGAGSTSASLVWILGLQKTLECVGTGPFLVHRAKERASWTFRTRIVTTAVTVATTFALAGSYGAVGAACGIALGSALAVGAWWTRYLIEDRRVPRPAAQVPAGAAV